jgi:16S rRNA processing protein RimM
MKTPKENFKLIGKVKDAHGLAGEIFILVFSKEVSWAKKIKTIALCRQQNLTSARFYQVKRAKPHKEGLIVALENVSDRNQSESLRGELFFIPEDLLISKKGERIFLSEILGYQVFDGDEAIGEVKDFSSNGPQDLLIVAGGKDSYEIPFVESFIVKIDFDKNSVHMKLPEGLLSLQRKEDE